MESLPITSTSPQSPICWPLVNWKVFSGGPWWARSWPVGQLQEIFVWAKALCAIKIDNSRGKGFFIGKYCGCPKSRALPLSRADNFFELLIVYDKSVSHPLV